MLTNPLIWIAIVIAVVIGIWKPRLLAGILGVAVLVIATASVIGIVGFGLFILLGKIFGNKK
jgi:hypothetical protein